MKNNPFESMQSFMDEDFLSKILNPNIADISDVSDGVKNSAEALYSTANVASENIQSIIKRNNDHVQKHTLEVCNGMKEAISVGDINQVTDCQKKYITNTANNSINNLKEMIDISTKSTMEMLDTVNENLKKTVTSISKAAKNK